MEGDHKEITIFGRRYRRRHNYTILLLSRLLEWYIFTQRARTNTIAIIIIFIRVRARQPFFNAVIILMRCREKNYSDGVRSGVKLISLKPLRYAQYYNIILLYYYVRARSSVRH